MEPVDVVHLDLAEVPLVLAVALEAPLEHLGVAVEGEAEVADALLLAQFHAPVERAVLEVALREGLEPAVADGVEEVVVDVVGLEELQRLLEHLPALVERILLRREVGELRRHDVVASRIAACRERPTEARLGPAHAVGRRGVEVVDPAVEHELHLRIEEFLVDGGVRGAWNRLAAGAAGRVEPVGRRQAHRAVAEQRHLASVSCESGCHRFSIFPFVVLIIPKIMV